MPSIGFELPFPPSVNHYWGQRVIGKHVQRFIGKRGVEFRQQVDVAVQHCKEFCFEHFCKPDVRLVMFIQVISPDRRRRDLDNLLKATQDALQHAGVYLDDEQIDQLVVNRDKEQIIKGGKLIITLGVK